MKIDSHQHFWQYNLVTYSWITDEMSPLKRDFLPDELNREPGTNDIDASIAVQADHSEGETLFLLKLAEQYDTIVGVVGWLDITADELPERLNFFSKFQKLRADCGTLSRPNPMINLCCGKPSCLESHA